MTPNPVRASERLTKEVLVRIAGAGTSDPDVEVGHGVDVTRTAEGVIKFAFRERLGKFFGIKGYMFAHATPGNVKGHTVTRDTYDSTDNFVAVSIWDASNAAEDLDSGETLELTFVFGDLDVDD